MNAVQKIKARHEEKVWADIEGIMRVMMPTLEKNAKARWEAEVKASKAKARVSKVNMALQRAGIPLRVL